MRPRRNAILLTLCIVVFALVHLFTTLSLEPQRTAKDTPLPPAQSAPGAAQVTITVTAAHQFEEQLNWLLKHPVTQCHSTLPLGDASSTATGPRQHVFMAQLSADVSDIVRCAVISAAIAHPCAHVVVLARASAPLLNVWTNHTNVHVVLFDYELAFHTTPLEGYYASGEYAHSDWPLLTLSDALRYALLYRFGGVYLDTDVFVLRSLHPLQTDTLGIEGRSPLKLGTAVMIVRSTHSPFLLHVMHQLRGILLAKNVFAATGPLLLTRVYYKSDQHFNVSVLDEAAFYPIHWRHFSRLWIRKRQVEATEAIEQRNPFAVHLWNHMAQSKGIPCQEGSWIERFMHQNCPL